MRRAMSFSLCNEHNKETVSVHNSCAIIHIRMVRAVNLVYFNLKKARHLNLMLKAVIQTLSKPKHSQWVCGLMCFPWQQQ